MIYVVKKGVKKMLMILKMIKV